MTLNQRMNDSMKMSVLGHCIVAAVVACSLNLSADMIDKSSVASAGQSSDMQLQDLTEQQLQDIRKRVLKRCGLSSKLTSNRLPWYFHYEFGVELVRRGAAGEALEPLQMTANLKPQPMRDARMYGAWFINYQPYFQISLAYSELGEWDRAWDAIRISENLVEFSNGDIEYEKFTSLKSLIAQHRQPNS